MSILVFVPSKLLIWASQQAVTRSDHLTIQTGHCPHCFKMVQQMSLSSWNGTTAMAHHGRRCQAWSKSSGLQGEGNQIAAWSNCPATDPYTESPPNTSQTFAPPLPFDQLNSQQTAHAPHIRNGQHLQSQGRRVGTLLTGSSPVMFENDC